MTVKRRRQEATPWVLALGAAAVMPAVLAASVQEHPVPAQATPLLSTTAPAQAASPAAVPVGQTDPQGGIISGRAVAAAAGSVASGKQAPSATPLPGVTVVATNTLTGKKYSAATDVTGAYRLLIPRNGRYVVRAEFAAFAPLTSEVLLNATQHSGTANFSLELASRVAARSAAAGGTDAVAGALGLSGAQVQALGRGLQSLRGSGSDAESASEGGGNTGAALPTLGGLAGGAGSGSESVAVNGQAGQTTGLANLNEDEIRDRIGEAIAQARRNGGQQGEIAEAVVGMIGSMVGSGSGRGGPGGGGGRGGGGGGFGAFRNFNPAQIHGSLFYGGGNGALDATRFSLTGNPIQPAYSTNRYGLTLAGSPQIPGLIKPNTKQFVFLNVTGGRNSNPVNINGTVPTDAQRTGDFSGFTRTINGQPAAATIFDPQTGQPFAGNIIPANRLSPQALALLNYYPHANQATTGATPTAQNFNYQRVATAGQNSLQIASRFVRNFGADSGRNPFGGGGGFGGGRGGGADRQNGPKTLRQNVNANFAYSHNASDLRNFSPVLDSKSLTDGYNLGVGHSFSYGRLNNNSSVAWNRSHTATTNYFTGSAADPGAGLNIPKPQTVVPGFYNGVPGLQLTNFNSLNQAAPVDRIQQTLAWGDQLRWNHKKHNLNLGFQVRHVENNVIGGTNVFGAYSFSGVFTQQPGVGTSTSTPSGSSFADFLLSAPQQSTIQAGANKIHLRQHAYNIYANDDWRARANLTVNAGLRYEYFGPFTEINNQLVNLDHTADFLTVTPVLPGTTGPYSGAFPRSLVNPDHTLILPTLGLAYRPAKLKNTVLRAGYGISYNSTQYGSFANSLSYQQPFATTQTNVAFTGTNRTDPGCGTVTTPGTVSHTPYTLTTAFSCSVQTTTNNFAVNRNYRLGRVQVVNAGVQHTFGLGILLNVDYNGSFGGNLDLLRAPGVIGPSLFAGNSQPYTFEDAVGESRGHFLLLNARKRMSKGVAMQTSYRYGHSIDNASSIGGSGGNTTAQNFQRLDLEFGNSSLDLRHQLNGNFVAELPFGSNRVFLHNGGLLASAMDGFSLSGNYNFATGSYATPQYINTGAQLATGGNYTLRPDRVFAQGISGARTLRGWVNRGAFASPQTDNLGNITAFGTASRNSIEFPGTVSVDMSLSKSVSFGEIKNFEARLTANNAFNTVQYSGVDTVLNSSTFGQVNSVANPRRLTFNARYRF